MDVVSDKSRSFDDPSNVEANSPRARHRYVKSLSLGINDALFTPSRYPWMIFDLISAFALFQFGVWASPFGVFGRWTPPLLVGGAIYTICFCSVALGLGYYDRQSRFDYPSILRSAVVSNFFGAIASLTVVYFVFYNVIGRLTLVYGASAAALGILATRLVLAWLLRKNPYRFTIVESSQAMDEIIESVKRGKLSHFYVYIPWGSLFPNDESPSTQKLLASKIGDIVLTSSAMNRPEAIEFALTSLQSKFRIVDETAFYVQVLERLPVDQISKEWVLREGIAKRQVVTMAAKRVQDIVLTLIASTILAPLLLLIALIIKLTSPGPIFFNQRRQGRYSQPFKMYKFRTMHTELSSESAAGGFTVVGDQRVTWIGKILRPLHFDELPQLLNIFLGDMSIVGPRPEALEFAKRMRQQIPLYELRYLVRPGLTGHAQINQGYAMDSVLDTKTKLSYDLYYLCYHSVWLDLQLILRTVFFLTKRAR